MPCCRNRTIPPLMESWHADVTLHPTVSLLYTPQVTLFHLDSSGFPEIPGGTAEMAGGFQGRIPRIPGAGTRRGIPGI